MNQSEFAALRKMMEQEVKARVQSHNQTTHDKVSIKGYETYLALHSQLAGYVSGVTATLTQVARDNKLRYTPTKYNLK